VVLACRVLEALGPHESSTAPDPQAVSLWPAMAAPATAVALMHASAGPEAWPLSGREGGRPPWPEDDGEGHLPMWPVWYHMRVLGMWDKAGSFSSSAEDGNAEAVAALRRAEAGNELAERLRGAGADKVARRAAAAAAARRVYDDPDVRSVREISELRGCEGTVCRLETILPTKLCSWKRSPHRRRQLPASLAGSPPITLPCYP
jgi:hypothetical protein